jgi:hypothetical protein
MIPPPQTHSALTVTGYKRPVWIAVLTTGLVAALSYLLPQAYAATGVGLAFLAVTYWAALRSDDSELVRHYGLSFGGLLEAEPIRPSRLLRDAFGALGWALLVAAIIFPLFWLGYLWWWQPRGPFVPAPVPSVWDDVVGQLLVIALPEEAFYRGYLQTSLDEAWKPRFKVLGAYVGPGLFVASALFAVGHLLTETNPERLAVFFPALVFGWLRAKTGGVGASIVFHAMCNLFAAYLAQSYGLLG